jgi:hypothetical protein
MNRSDGKKWQAKRISEALFPATNYLIRLRQRMEQRGFQPDDPLYREVCAAYKALQRLGMSMHYLSCDGVGRPSSEGDSPKRASRRWAQRHSCSPKAYNPQEIAHEGHRL